MKSYALPFVALLFSVLLYFVNFSTLPYVSYAYNLLRLVIYPLFELKGNIVETTKRAIDTYVFLKNVNEENQRLKKELQEYKMHKAQLLTCENNLGSLIRAMDLPFQIKEYPVVYVSVIAYDPSGRDTFVLVNGGQDKGLSEGMLVFWGDELVGIVDMVYGGSSRVRTVFSEEFTLSAGLGDKAYIYKGGFPLGSLLHVHLDDEVKVGDVVYLRVPGKYFPQLNIGRVWKVSGEEKGFFKRVEVKPFADIRKIPVLLVIKERL